MSKTTAALEAAVAAVIEAMPKDGSEPTRRQRAHTDRAFAQVLKIIAPRIRHFIRQYGLSAHWDDAEQCCAIGVHRAIQAYDPDKAQFTTFVNWQLRGELQSLRFRLMTDQRRSAKKVEATTVSLNAVSLSDDGESSALEAMIEDEDALERTECGAAAYMADRTCDALLDAYVDQLRQTQTEALKRRARTNRSVQTADPSMPRFRARTVIDPDELEAMEERLAMQRAIVERRLRDESDSDDSIDPQERERLRQVAKRAARTIAGIATSDPRFAGLAAAAPQPRRRTGDTPSILPPAADATSRPAAVVVIEPAAEIDHRLALHDAHRPAAQRARAGLN